MTQKEEKYDKNNECDADTCGSPFRPAWGLRACAEMKLPLVRRAPSSAIAYAETGGAARLRVALRALATPRLGFLPFGL